MSAPEMHQDGMNTTKIGAPVKRNRSKSEEEPSIEEVSKLITEYNEICRTMFEYIEIGIGNQALEPTTFRDALGHFQQLNQRLFKAPPKRKNKIPQGLKEAPTDSECSICLDCQRGKKVELGCSHRFHSVCIGRWFKTQDLCPLCRDKIA